MKNVAIIGAGYTGLSAAYELSKKGYSVDVYEAGDSIGGLAGDFKIEGQSIELAYHHIFTTDKYIINLSKELGSYKYLKWFDSSVAIYQDGQFYPFKTAIDLLKFKPLKFHNRLRAGLTVLYLQKQKNYKKLESISAVDWLNKYAGKQVYEIIWEPLLRGKFDTDYKNVSMAWLWARINTRSNSRAKGKGEQLGYFMGGFNKFTDSLATACTKNGVKIHTDTKVGKLLDGPKLAVNGQQKTYDQIIVTTATNTFLGLIPQNYKDYAAQLAQVRYLDALLLVFSSDQDLSSYYWHNVNDKNIPFLVFIQHTNLVGKDSYGGKNVYYIAAYLNKDSKYLALSPKDLQTQWFSSLKKMYPDFDSSDISELKVIHLKDAQHIVDAKYTSYIPSIKTPIKGLYLSNFSQIYPEDRGVNYAIRAGQQVANLIKSGK